MCVCVLAHTIVHMWRLENNFGETVLTLLGWSLGCQAWTSSAFTSWAILQAHNFKRFTIFFLFVYEYIGIYLQVYVRVDACEGACMHACHMRTHNDLVYYSSGTIQIFLRQSLSFRTSGLLITFLASQWSPIVFLSPPLHSLNCKHTPLHPAFYMGARD